MTFAVLGASGHTGRMVVRHILRSGHNARALVRDPQKMNNVPPEFAQAGAFEIIRGDVSNYDAIAQLTSGADAVVSALGPSDFQTGFKVHSNAALMLSRQMPKAGISRYVSVSGASLSVPSDRFSVRGKFFSSVAFVLTKTSGHLNRLLSDKRKEYEILKESPLDWTIVRPPWIVPGDYVCDANITPFSLEGSKVRVAELAKALVDLAMSERFNRQAVFINSR